jgi:hypothetical protein
MGDDDIKIDLTAADRADGLLPIRWVGPAADSNGNGHARANGNGNRGNEHSAVGEIASTVIAVVPRIVSLASLIPPVPPTPPEPAPESPVAESAVITLFEPDAWSEVPNGSVRGGRFVYCG